MESLENQKKIISIFEGFDEENLFYTASVEAEFKISPETLGTMLISLCDNVTKCVPEYALEEFDNALIKFFTENYKKRFNSNDIEYVP